MMHHLLHRNSSSNNEHQAQELIQTLQSSEDEGVQLASITDLCQMLVMGSEDTLAGFPVKSAVPVFISLLQMEHNFELMHNACRALTYMVEALPHSSDIAIDSVPVLLDKLKNIECMDVAEQSLQALEKLSRKHGRVILQSNGISACLTFLEFFSSSAQRAAFSMVANCCQHLVGSDDFAFVRGSLTTICDCLVQQDKKLVENACICLTRLIESFCSNERILKEIAVQGLLTNVLQLLVVTPPVINSQVFVLVVHMLVTMCTYCSDLAVVLLKLGVAETISFLLVGSPDHPTQQSAQVLPRTPQELYEIVSLIGELMPKLPCNGMFSMNCFVYKSPACCEKETVTWQWKDDRGSWRPYSLCDNHTIEVAHQSGDRRVVLSTRGHTYTIDFTTMQQTDSVTGSPTKVLRQPTTAGNLCKSSCMSNMVKTDARTDIFLEHTQLTDNFMKSLFGVLFEIYDSLASSTIRQKCVYVMLRVIYYAKPDLLRLVLSNLPISSHIASLMMSKDQVLVVSALQMAFILMEKLPDVFSVYFHREGVVHEISKLSSTDKALDLSIKKDPSVDSSHAALSSDMPPDKSHNIPLTQLRLSDVLKRKKPLRYGSRKAASRTCDDSSVDISSSSCSADTAAAATHYSQSAPATTQSRLFGAKSGSSSRISFLSRWVQSGADKSKDEQSPKALKMTSSQKHSRHVDTREKIKQWIVEHAVKFLNKYFNGESTSGNFKDVFNRLSQAVQCLGRVASNDKSLQEIAAVMSEGDVSTFEIIHSGLINKLLDYLTSTKQESDDWLSREARILAFVRIFCGRPDSGMPSALMYSVPLSMSGLVSKIISVLHHIEEFQVKVVDPVTGAGSSFGHKASSAMKFFSTHQIKFELHRHPSCTNVKQWKGSLVKIDPLASVQTIERFLIMRGYVQEQNEVTQQNNDNDAIANDDEDFSDSDIDDNLAAVSLSQNTARHQLELLIGSHVLPYTMTIYQAVKQYSVALACGSNDAYNRLCRENSIWHNTHTLYYRSVTSSDTFVNTSAVKKSKSTKAHDSFRVTSNDNESSTPRNRSVLDSLLSTNLAGNVTVNDPALDALTLLQALHSVNTYWHLMCNATDLTCQAILPGHHFHSSKLTAKANRHLLDPLMIISGNMPAWLTEIGYACPFLFPFETRLLLLHASAMDRERTLQHLLETTHDVQLVVSADRSERSITPRLERRKVVVCRENVLSQAERLLEDPCWSKAILEVEYENEVGTGLGPTLEFYTIISHEMQKSDRNMWRGEAVQRNDSQSEASNVFYMYSHSGLFPAPIPKHVKPSTLFSIKSKFLLLGKVLAKALIDSRMLDIPLSPAFYKWLLGHEATLTLADLRHVDPALAKTVGQLQDIVLKKKQKESGDPYSSQQLSMLTIDGCSVEDLDLDFVLPGHPEIELKRGGSDIPVTLDNLEEYVKLVVHWTLHEGVHRQFEAIREGFDLIFSLSSLSLFSPEEHIKRSMKSTNHQACILVGQQIGTSFGWGLNFFLRLPERLCGMRVLDQLFCGSIADSWDVRYLMEACRPDHGYTHDSQAVKFLYEILSAYNGDEQRQFIRFLTGSPRLPVGGLKSLLPPLTIVRTSINSADNPDDFLPSVMTCVNYLKLPDYSSIDVMRQKLVVAICEGQFAFHLS